KYFLSGGYLDQSSIYKSGDMGFRRYNARSNIDVQVNDRLSASLDLAFRNEFRYAPQTPLRDIWINLKTALPIWSATLPDNSRGGAYSGFQARSPVAQTHRRHTGFEDDIQRFFTGKLSLNYEIQEVKGLEAKFSLSYSSNHKFNKVQDKPFEVLSYDHTTSEYTSWGINGGNSLNETFSQFVEIYPQLSLNYDRTFGDHSFQGLLLWEGIDTEFNFLSGGRVDLLSTEIPYLFAGSPDNLTNNGGALETGRMSYVGRVNYNYKGKYLLEGTF